MSASGGSDPVHPTGGAALSFGKIALSWDPIHVGIIRLLSLLNTSRRPQLHQQPLNTVLLSECLLYLYHLLYSLNPPIFYHAYIQPFRLVYTVCGLRTTLA